MEGPDPEGDCGDGQGFFLALREEVARGLSPARA
ncbi:hypothetical protein ACP4OV_008057 [Aristida adscensionis]